MTAYNLMPETPSLASDLDNQSVCLGTEFYSTAPEAWVTEVRQLVSNNYNNWVPIEMAIYDTYGTKVAGNFTMPTPVNGTWCTYTLPTPLALTQYTHYRVVTRWPGGFYPSRSLDFATGAYGTTTTYGDFLVLPNEIDAVSSKQGFYTYSATMTFPNETFNGGNYFADVEVTDVDPAGGGAFDNWTVWGGATERPVVSVSRWDGTAEVIADSNETAN